MLIKGTHNVCIMLINQCEGLTVTVQLATPFKCPWQPCRFYCYSDVLIFCYMQAHIRLSICLDLFVPMHL